jgi:hypothetical protein
MNLLEVKKVVNQIVLMLETMIEDHGQDGDLETMECLITERTMFVTASEELSQLLNSDIFPFYLPKLLQEHVPSLNLALFQEYMETLTRRKKSTVERLNAEINSYTNMLSLFKPNDSSNV